MSQSAGGVALAVVGATLLAGCVSTTQLPTDEQSQRSALTREQRDYLYDYYLGTLVPCLEVQGVRVENPPTREQFAATGVGIGWNPYYAMDSLSFGEVVADDALLAACPSFPKDERFDEWRISTRG